MGWATQACAALCRGETVRLRPRGHSMEPRIRSGDRVTVAPCDPATLKVDDIVLVRLHGTEYLHLVRAIQGERYLIGNNHGRINGWVGRNALYGKLTAVEAP